jgi:hypothetical protein
VTRALARMDGIIGPVASPACWAAGGVKGGYDAHAAYPADSPVAPRDLIASVYHLLGVPEENTRRRRGTPSFYPPGKVASDLFA